MMKIQTLKTTLMLMFVSLAMVCSTLQQASAEPTEIQTPSVEKMLININQADVSTLAKLPGIGKTKAQSIISYRELNGNFQSVEELTNVKGVGPKLLSKVITMISI